MVKKQPVLLKLADIQASLRPASENAMERNGKALCTLLKLRDVSEIVEVMERFTLLDRDKRTADVPASEAKYMALYLYALAHTEETGATWIGDGDTSKTSVGFVVYSNIAQAQRQLARDNFGEKVHADAEETNGKEHGNYHIIATAEFFSVALW
jgi:hypothetical protein